jgi:Arc/MetJ-type ribon-helix-helix transcriptional regulator
MVMDTLQIRLSKGIMEKIDELVESGLYANRSDIIREAVRRYILQLELIKGKALKTAQDTQEIHPFYKM